MEQNTQKQSLKKSQGKCLTAKELDGIIKKKESIVKCGKIVTK